MLAIPLAMVLYLNRDDPSMMVEKRLGIGYTLHLGNMESILFVAAVPALILGLIAVAIIGAAR